MSDFSFVIAELKYKLSVVKSNIRALESMKPEYVRKGDMERTLSQIKQLEEAITILETFGKDVLT